MGIFSRKRKTVKGGTTRYRSRYFQSRIRQARGFKRTPKIAPRAKKRISLRPVSIPGLLLLTLVFGIFLTAGYFLVISDYFLVKSVGVSGNIQTNQEIVEDWILEEGTKKYFFIIPKNHQLVINRASLEEILKQNSPYISKILRKPFKTFATSFFCRCRSEALAQIASK